MATMIHRTTFTLDNETMRRLRSLASRLHVSQAEVVRRALAQMEDDTVKRDPVAMLQALHESGQGIDPTKAGTYLAQVYKDRRKWRGK
jgi:predicted transcriptional regulator